MAKRLGDDMKPEYFLEASLAIQIHAAVAFISAWPRHCDVGSAQGDKEP
jgi:hypothetical protein